MTSATDPTPLADLPWPGDELAIRVAGEADRVRFHESGKQSFHDIQAVLALVGKDLDSFSDILDFGCGCGRILLWLGSVQGSLHGVDIDERAIRWVNANLDFVTAKANQPLPPLDYPDGSFDLVYNHSVFTHIDANYQDQWLAELQRVTRPGGILLLTVHGEHAFHEFETASRNAAGDPSVFRSQLAREGIVFMPEDPWVGSAFPDFYHTTFHAPWYVFQHWGQYFDIRGYVPRGSLGYQDFILLQRRADDAPAGEPIAPAVDWVGAAALSALSAPSRSALPSIERAASYLRQGADVASPTTHGRAAHLYRRLVLRALRHHDEQERRAHGAVVDALRELDSAGGGQLVGGLTVSESLTRLWDALKRHADRVSRLETDLWEAIRALEARDPRT